MKREQVVVAIKRSLKEVLNMKEVDHITEKTSLFDDLALDSTSVLELLMVLEDEVEGLYVDPETLEPHHFETVGSLATYIESHLKDVTEHVG
ncbi:acyl carrier protein [Mechercharimyces sp. CAU 1602]|uniref:acyl carrier protein n=1 Tax=Mechercharimyces sp. CAU 1602 TaxID=2973933 RepID=UPI002161BCB5|nr:phosphopantetheine-binding protein [Mechercharimyces sp. CAU 1602]MCS1352492.1 phosphopantetheine-binding protein [Mechercharimyces sp. CAU 1602]